MTKKNPTLTVNFLSRLFFCWVSELFAIGSKRQLEADDLYDICDVDRSRNLTRRLEEAWEEQRRAAGEKGKRPQLSLALIKTFWRYYAMLGLLLLVEESSKIAQPLMIAGLLESLSRRSSDPGAVTDAYLYATGVALCSVVLAVVHHPYFFSAIRLGMWLRISCCNLIYRKVLRLDQFAMLQTSTGQVVNLMTNDVQRLDYCALFLHFLWLGPLEAVVVFLVLWRHVGMASLAGVAALILLSPLQVWIGKLFARLRAKTAHLTDERVKLTSEMIHGMRVVKMYCWEPMFGKIISHIRKQEMMRIAMAYLCNVVRLAQFMVHTKLAMLVVLAVAFLQGQLASQADNSGQFTVANVFLCLSMFNAIRVSLTIFVPYSIQFGAESFISISRMQKLLELPERADDPDDKDSEKASLLLTDFCASWNHEDPESRVLSNINLEVTGPELIAVVGPVGCGKSSLIMAILGELPAVAGSLSVQGTVAYAAQQPWVFSATVRENIIFGREWDQERYEDAVNASALRLDLEQLPNGDQTMVGERGVSLSGGQRARVGLARVLYSNADVYLLDDPLSAVDAGVAKHLFNRCIRTHLRHSIRVLVTHQLQFLKAVDRILVLQDGAVMASGTYAELVEQGINLDMIIKASGEEKGRGEPDSVGSGTGLNAVGLSVPNLRPSGDPHHLRPTPVGSSLSIDSMFTSVNAIDTLVETADEETASPEEEEEEDRASGLITWKVFASYFLKGANGWLILPIFLIFALCQSSYVLCDWWLTLWMKWERAYELARTENGSLAGNMSESVMEEVPLVGDIQSTTTFMWILAALTLAVLVTSVIRSITFYIFTLCASRRLHREMLFRLVKAPVRFFDTNSAGRILNRFSKDTGVMDDMLPPALSDFCICTFLVMGNLIVNFIISPWTIAAVAPLVVVFIFLRRYYMQTSRNVKRLEAVARSPVFSHVNNTLLGLATLRSSKSESLFARRFEELQDQHSQAWYAFLVTSRWFGIRLDWLCVIFVIAVCYLSIATSNIDDAKAGLMLTYAVGMLGMFQWCIRQSTEVENHMVSVERIVDYTRLPQEPPLDSPPGQSPPASWPERGEVRYSHVDFRYVADGPQVLHGLTWRVHAEEKVGIVGRTGAGKSSLVASLFRLAEPESGVISIDGRAVGAPMGLHDLRQRISIIPQDPVLFTGTVRWNLDPMERQRDDAMWRALEDVQMKEAIKAMPSGLDSKIAEGGVNLSVGQRQLMCLARALLRNNRVLIIDEATANVDPRTDELIQETIRSKFAHCTVLTIAHRLHTVMDSDRIMVLDEGRVVEFDHPHALLQRTDGLFRQMVHHLDTREATALRRLAESAFKRRKVFDKDEEEEEKTSLGDVNATLPVDDDEAEHKMALLNGHGVRHPLV